MRRTLVLIGALAALLPVLARAEPIPGRACYHYSDNESIIVARDIALSLAKRNALESYIVFVQSTGAVENFALKNDLITSLAGGFLHDLQVTEESEDPAKREVCRAIRANVEPLEIKQQTIAQINIFKRERDKKPTGLPESNLLRMVKLEEGDCEGKFRESSKCFVATTVCKGEGIAKGPRITLYDKDGVPDSTREDSPKNCSSSGNVLKFHLPRPPAAFTFRIDIPS